MRRHFRMKSRYEYEQCYIDDLYNAYIARGTNEDFDDFIDTCYEHYCETHEDSEEYYSGKML